MINLTTPFAVADAYKLSHWDVLPKGTTRVYSNFTPRTSRIPDAKYVIVYGIRYALLQLNKQFETFFRGTEEEAVENYCKFWKRYFGTDAIDSNVERVRALYNLDYLPIEVHSMPEGSKCPIGMPFLVITNTHDDFAWITNFVETIISNRIWKMVTVATIAHMYKRKFVEYAERTSDNDFMPNFQGHDFSMRGMSGLEDAMCCGSAWLTSFCGSDTMPTLDFIDSVYPGTPADTLLATSVPASEHSIQCAYLFDTDDTTVSDRNYVRGMMQKYPTGLVSVVSDGFDFWRLVTVTLPELKEEILQRDGKLVIRPDSSPKTPVEIIIGDPEADTEHERKGLIEVLWDIFGGTINSKGYKVLDSHIGAIYGDSITLEYQDKILAGLEAKVFDTTNIVLGVGSYSLQYVTRDTFGMAIKATAIEVDDKVVPIYKDPKTDNGTKKSARGYLAVTKEGEFIQNIDDYGMSILLNTAMDLSYCDGRVLEGDNFVEIRERVAA